ncbi:MAG: DNA polymerase (family 10) [Verrucomicrobiales bacterium]|jgi:DNA polymerase (family 10)
MTLENIAEVLENIATFLELKGENHFKTRAYRNGAEIVTGFSGDFVQLARDNDLKGIKGIGDALAQKIHELVSTGKLDYYENLRSEFPEGILELFEVQGLGAKKVKALHDALGVGNLADLKRVCESGEVTKLAGFGAKSVEKILAALEFRESNASLFRLGSVAKAAEEILELLKSLPEVTQASTAGSFRRGKEILHDLDFIVATNQPAGVMEAFVNMPEVAGVTVHGATKSSVFLESGVQCDLRAVTGAEFPFAIAYFTGSKEHNVAMRSRALKRGYTLNEYRLAPVEDGKKVAKPLSVKEFNEEADIYRALDLDFVPPALRENSGEIEAAEEGRLPKLIETENLRGTFHNHTKASDGKNTLGEMAAAAQELGLQYLGIADHSKSSFQANGLDEDRLLEQLDEIDSLNQEFGDDFKLFAGTECDILKDGSLDFEDEILEQLDYVVASVHSSFTLSEEDMTKRLIRAIENPNVTMLGHLTGRLLLKRDPYALNVPKIIDAAAANDTIIELNANPWRLDMDWRWWKLAKEKGVKCSINPDAHNTAGLQFLHFGVLQARKGWLTRKDVVNCLPLGEIEDALGVKR